MWRAATAILPGQTRDGARKKSVASPPRSCGEYGWHRDRIAALFRLASRDLQAAIDDIESHCEETEAEYQGILERHHSDRYPPDVQAKVERCWKLRKSGLPGVAARYQIGFGERFDTRTLAPA